MTPSSRYVQYSPSVLARAPKMHRRHARLTCDFPVPAVRANKGARVVDSITPSLPNFGGVSRSCSIRPRNLYISKYILGVPVTQSYERQLYPRPVARVEHQQPGVQHELFTKWPVASSSDRHLEHEFDEDLVDYHTYTLKFENRRAVAPAQELRSCPRVARSSICWSRLCTHSRQHGGAASIAVGGKRPPHLSPAPLAPR